MKELWTDITRSVTDFFSLTERQREQTEQIESLLAAVETFDNVRLRIADINQEGFMEKVYVAYYILLAWQAET